MNYHKQNFIKGQILKADHLNAIEDGIVSNSEELDQLKGDLFKHDNVLKPFLSTEERIGINKCDMTKLSNGWIEVNGNFTPKDSGFVTTDYIDVSEFNSGYVSAYTCKRDTTPYSNLGMFSCCFFSDINGTVVTGGNRGSHNAIDTCAIEIPNESKYVKISFNTSDAIFGYMVIDKNVTSSSTALNYVQYEIIPASDGEKIASEKYVDETTKDAKDIASTVEVHEELLNKYERETHTENFCDLSAITNGWIHESTGVITDNDGFRLSGYIDISNFKSGYVSAYACGNVGSPSNYPFYRCCFFSDTNGTVVSGGKRPNPSDITNAFVAIPDGAKYVRVSWSHSTTRPLYMVVDKMVDDISKAIDYIKCKVIPIQKIASISDVKQWIGKTWLSYGDSITAIGNGNPKGAWQEYVTNTLGFSNQIVRGIGGSTYMYKTIPVFVNADGSYNSRADSGDITNPSSYTVPEGTTAHWSYMASWDRITAMIPDTIKDSIDLIFTFGVNDSGQISDFTFNPPSFSASNDTDALWMSSSENVLGGDYDVNTFIGAWSSCIMKLQKRCPNALIVCGTGWSGRGIADNSDSAEYSDSGKNIWKEGKLVKEIANYFSIPCIDIWGTSNVNPWNRSKYNEDIIHPYKLDGKKELARAVIDGLSVIHPRMDVD